jgi:hypothetical protein
MSLAALLQGKLPPRAPEHVVGSSLAAIDEDVDVLSSPVRDSPRKPPGVGSLYGAFEHDAAFYADDDGTAVAVAASPLAPVVVGQGQQQVLAAEDVDEQVARLQAWEEQLQQYSDSLTEKGWEEWKKGQVTQIMQQLRRTVVPDVWREEVQRAEAEAAVHRERVQLSSAKEAALLKRIDELENGPGCAKELREKLEEAELQLQQQKQRERQQSVFKQLLTTGAVSDNTGGRAPAMRRRATVAGDALTVAGAARRPGLTKGAQSAPSVVADGKQQQQQETDAAGGEGGESGEGEGEGEEEEDTVAVLQMQLARARQEAAEAHDELSTLKAQYDERTSSLEAALEAERTAKRHATEALESQHVAAGVHEAQEMVQLRMELVAANEELDFLRAREAKVHEEENRLQMVAEMSKVKALGCMRAKADVQRASACAPSISEREHIRPARPTLRTRLGRPLPTSSSL